MSASRDHREHSTALAFAGCFLTTTSSSSPTAMPEEPECLAHYLSAKWALKALINRRILSIHADLTKEEAIAAQVAIGYIQKLTPQVRIERGQFRNQTALLGAMLQDLATNTSTIAITDLEIIDVHHTVRALIVNLGPVWLRVCSVPLGLCPLFSGELTVIPPGVSSARISHTHSCANLQQGTLGGAVTGAKLGKSITFVSVLPLT